MRTVHPEAATTEQIRAYLAAKGWQRFKAAPPYTDLWRHPDGETWDGWITARFQPEDADPVRDWGILESLAKIEGRCEHEILTDILGQPDPATLLSRIEAMQADLTVLARVGDLYLRSLDDDPANEHLTLGGAMLVTEIREAVERQGYDVRWAAE